MTDAWNNYHGFTEADEAYMRNMEKALEDHGCMACDGSGFTEEALEIDGRVGRFLIACSCEAGAEWHARNERRATSTDGKR